MTRAEYLKAMGEHFGFPPCCVEDFVTRNGPAPRRLFHGTGYVPCPTCNAKAEQIGTHAFVEQFINPRRKADAPFPRTGTNWAAIKEQYDAKPVFHIEERKEVDTIYPYLSLKRAGALAK